MFEVVNSFLLFVCISETITCSHNCSSHLKQEHSQMEKKIYDNIDLKLVKLELFECVVWEQAPNG